MTVHEIIAFWNLLDNFDVSCEEQRIVDEITLKNYQSINTGNSSMHYILKENNHRIVLQIHKSGHRAGDVDVVQGDPTTEIDFEDLIHIINSDPRTYTDNRLNKLFIYYWNVWNKYCSSCDFLEEDAIYFEFGPDINLYYYNSMWHISTTNVSDEDLMSILSFINAVNDISRG